MGDRYPERRFPAADNRGGRSRSAAGEGDPLEELARLIGQSDPHATVGRANLRVQPKATQQAQYDHQEDSYELPPETDETAQPSPPSWLQRVARQEPTPLPQPDYPSAVHPLHRYAAPNSESEPDYDEAQAFDEQSYDENNREPDLSRYDDALYGGLEPGMDDAHHDRAYADDGYAHQDEYGEEVEEPKRRRSMVTVFAVLALAVFGVGGAYGYRTYVGSARTGEPPIIRADAGPTKIIPAPTDAGSKVPDRMLSGDGAEKIVPREEAPVDVNARSGPRVVFPPLNQGGPPPSAAIAPATTAAITNAANGTLPNNEPRKIKTFSVRGDQGDATPTATASAQNAPAKPAAANARAAAPAAAPRTPSSANASAANANTPLSLAPQTAQPAAEPQTRLAATNPTQPVPSATSTPGSTGGGYLVQVSSQRSEADAQASYKALQGKFPSVLGSHAPVIKRADLGDKGVYYRAMVGPFNSSDEASQFCGSLKSAGGQCVVQKN
jgi:cell division septation protein DedD